MRCTLWSPLSLVGNCVGEKNHKRFYWFLFFQCIELSLAECSLITYLANTAASKNWWRTNVWVILLTVVLGFFCLMVLSLLLFHTYLSCANLTSWETLSWYRISYLKDWASEWGSPFSKGVFKNLKHFCCNCKKGLEKWKLPKFKVEPQQFIA